MVFDTTLEPQNSRVVMKDTFYMPKITDTIPINNPEFDKRVKLTPEDKTNIMVLYHLCRISLRGLSRLYKVDRKTIKFVLFPEFYLQELERNKGNWKKYYKKEKHKIDIRKHRAYKDYLYATGKIGKTI